MFSVQKIFVFFFLRKNVCRKNIKNNTLKTKNFKTFQIQLKDLELNIF